MIGSQRAIVTVAIGRFEPLIDRGLIDVLREDRHVDILASGLDHQALEVIAAEEMPRVVILGEAIERGALGRLRETAPTTGVVVLAHEPTHEYGMRLLAAGATCVARNAPTVDLIAAVHLVARGERAFISADGKRVQRCYPSEAPALTDRETEVLGCLSRGRSNAEIALALEIGVETVRTHVASILRKLNAQSRLELVGMPRSQLAQRMGLSDN